MPNYSLPGINNASAEMPTPENNMVEITGNQPLGLEQMDEIMHSIVKAAKDEGSRSVTIGVFFKATITF